MAEFAIEFNPEQMIGKLNDLQKLVIPKAAEMALNETAFAIREHMKQTTKEVFDRPVPLTVNSTLYKKASGDQQQLQATIFIRDDVPKGSGILAAAGFRRTMLLSPRYLQAEADELRKRDSERPAK
jgi:hypothetical protein